ncbi:MAG: hypothetical protein GWN46_15170, partial [Gammaproteobacteria bacterium]|nr:hypothetical protein [Gammaproteobacteria bacterium]
PSWASLPGQTPARLRDLLERCLAKDVRERLRDVGDVRLEIERAQTAGPDAPSVAAMASSTSTGRPSPILAIGLVLLGAVVGIGLWVVLSPRDVPAARTTRLSLMVPDGQLLEHATVAPDGRTLAYVSLDEADGRTRLFLRPLDRAEPTLVEEAHAPRWAVFSPDGQWIAWIGAQSEDASRRQLYKMPVDGSAPPSVLGEPGRWWSVVWPS